MRKSKKRSIVFIIFTVIALAAVSLIQFDIKTVFSKKNDTGESQLFLSNERNFILSKRDLGKKEKEFMPGEAIVKFKDEALGDKVIDSKILSGALSVQSHKMLSDVFKEFGITQSEKIIKSEKIGAQAFAKSDSRDRIVKLISSDLQNNPEKTEKMIEALSQLGEVEYADLN